MNLMIIEMWQHQSILKIRSYLMNTLHHGIHRRQEMMTSHWKIYTGTAKRVARFIH